MVGAGMAGLAAARALTDAGLPVVLFERGERIGGRVLSLELGDGVVEAGASHVWSFYRRTKWWLDRCGLTASLRPAPGRAPSPVSLGDLPGIARAALDVAWGWRRLAFERPERAAGLDTDSIAGYAARRLGAGFVDAALRPAFEWNAFCGLDELSQVLLLQAGRLYLGARPKVLAGGLSQLALAMADGLEIRLGSAGHVQSLRHSSRGVVVELASGASVDSRAVVIATPPAQAVELVDPGPALRAFLGGIRHSRVTRAWWHLPAEAGDPGQLLRSGSGAAPIVLVAARRGDLFKVAAVAYGAASAATRAGLDAPIGAGMEDLAAGLLPELRHRPHLAEASFHWDHAVTLFGPGHFRQLAALCPGRVGDAIALAGDYLISPTVEGAIVSGERAANSIRSHILGSVTGRAR
ncbi:MAG TPA: FAD-dependent oxidoreductase [Candidatus Nanopelagicaceae bacterium]|nr:FAD-dependent oxidoreductase [Candidatus Nanopelagicaceae bacterium]